MEAKVKPSEKSAWSRLKQNKPAMFGLVVIVCMAFIAVFAYWLAPDSSPYANRMIVEIGGNKPGYRQQFLALKKTVGSGSGNIVYRSVYGQRDQWEYIPISGYEVKQDSLVIQRFIDEGLSERQSFSVNPDSYRIETKTFILGTDKFGRDILSRLIVGTRVSLSVGLTAVLISLLIGTLLGALAGYYRGRTDNIVMWFINVIWSIPTMLLVFAITLALGKGFWQVFIAVGLTLWVSVARLIRGQVMTIRELEYIEAGRALGYSDLRILAKHILPNVIGPVMVIAASNFASAIIIEAGLSFLGVGVQSPIPSWGLMIKENYNFIITNNPMLAIIPGLAIMIVVLAFNLLGNGLRDAVDVRQ